MRHIQGFVSILHISVLLKAIRMFCVSFTLTLTQSSCICSLKLDCNQSLLQQPHPALITAHNLPILHNPHPLCMLVKQVKHNPSLSHLQHNPWHNPHHNQVYIHRDVRGIYLNGGVGGEAGGC